MTPQEQALLSAVLDQPNNDLPRLVYADYLEETGVEHQVTRAEFIRLQCALACEPIQTEWLIRERILLNKYGPAWLAPLRERGQPLFTPRSHGQFRRGFVEVVWMPAGWYVDKAQKIARTIPARELRLTHVTHDDLRELVMIEQLCRFHTLDVSDRKMGNAATGLICDSPHLAQLKVLRLRACDLDDDVINDLVEPYAGWELTELDVSLNRFSSVGVERLRSGLPTNCIITTSN